MIIASNNSGYFFSARKLFARRSKAAAAPPDSSARSSWSKPRSLMTLSLFSTSRNQTCAPTVCIWCAGGGVWQFGGRGSKLPRHKAQALVRRSLLRRARTTRPVGPGEACFASRGHRLHAQEATVNTAIFRYRPDSRPSAHRAYHLEVGLVAPGSPLTEDAIETWPADR